MPPFCTIIHLSKRWPSDEVKENCGTNLIVHYARGPQLWIFVDVILESLDFWLDSEIPESILVIPVYQIRTCRSCDT